MNIKLMKMQAKARLKEINEEEAENKDKKSIVRRHKSMISFSKS
jgi:hypothetical protein